MTQLASREGPWFSSLGASLLLHGALAAGVLGVMLQAPTLHPEAPDIWQGDMVTVDTVNDGFSSAVAPSIAVAGEAAAPSAPEPVAVEHQQQPAARVPRVHTQQTSARTIPTPAREAADPNQDLLRKVMGFRPASNASTEAVPTKSGDSAPSSPGEEVAPGLGGSHSQATVRNLPKAFTRALANAAAGDVRRWLQLDNGKVDEARITIEVGEKGEVSSHFLNREASVRMKDLTRRTLASLGAGQFALRETQVSAGTLTLRVEVFLSGSGDAAERVTEIGYQSPLPTREGKAYFTVSSGRHFEAKVRELR